MQRLGVPTRERLGQSHAPGRSPALQLGTDPRGEVVLTLEPVRHALDTRMQPGQRERAGTRAARCGRGRTRELREPRLTQRRGHCGRAEPPLAQHRAQHLVLARGAGRAPQPARVRTRLARVSSTRPQPQRRLEPAAGDAQVVQCGAGSGARGRCRRVLPACEPLDRGQALAQARGGHRRHARARHASGPATFRVSSPVTRSHSSSAMSSTCRVASSVWKP